MQPMPYASALRPFRRKLSAGRWTLLLFVALLLAAPGAWSGGGEEPAARHHAVQALEQVDLLQMPGIDLASVLEEDKLASPDKSRRRVAISLATSVAPGSPPGYAAASRPAEARTRGTWEPLEGQNFMWRLRVASPEARFLAFGFTRYRMPAGGRLFIYSPDYEWVAGPYTAADNESHGQLWTPMIGGAEAVIELTLPADRIDALDLVLGAVNHGYVDFGAASPDKSGACNVDVICSQGDGWRDEIRSVGHYSFTEGGSSYVCTGALINNTAEDSSPYFLTANHCVSTGTVASTVVIYWNYESDTCRTPGSPESGTPIPRPSSSQSGSLLRATNAPSDFTLLELDDDPDASHNVHLAGWDRGGGDPSSAVCIHHPAGHAKRISHEDDPLTTTTYLQSASPGDGTHFRVADWDSGTTEGGSSGSPLFDPGRRIVGQLHGGYAACGNDLADWYGKLSVSWTGGGTTASRLSDWLDPSATGATTLDGMDPVSPPPCRTGYRVSETVYSFEDISATGSTLPLTDDDHEYFAIPFAFPFYCEEYDNVAVGSNGVVYFEDVYLGLTNGPIPSDTGYGVNTFIAVLHDDLDPEPNGDVYYEIRGSAPNRRLIVQWEGVAHYPDVGGATFQAILYESSGEILLQYEDVDFGNASYDFGASATVGVQEDATSGLEYSYDEAVITNGLALKFTPGGAAISPVLHLLLPD